LRIYYVCHHEAPLRKLTATISVLHVHYSSELGTEYAKLCVQIPISSLGQNRSYQRSNRPIMLVSFQSNLYTSLTNWKHARWNDVDIVVDG